MITIDLIFSYWIFLWFILYEFSVVPYNPKFGVILGIIEIIGTAIVLLYHKFLYASNRIKKFETTLALFLLANFIIKCIPLYFLWNTTILRSDIFFTLLLFMIYNCYLFVIYNTDMIKVYTDIYNSVYYNKQDTPLMFILQKWILKN